MKKLILLISALVFIFFTEAQVPEKKESEKHDTINISAKVKSTKMKNGAVLMYVLEGKAKLYAVFKKGKITEWYGLDIIGKKLDSTNVKLDNDPCCKSGSQCCRPCIRLFYEEDKTLNFIVYASDCETVGGGHKPPQQPQPPTQPTPPSIPPQAKIVNPWHFGSYVYSDGSANRYVFSKDGFEYFPVSPAQSSSGTYSGGTYIKKLPELSLYYKLVDNIKLAFETKSDHSNSRQKGSSLIDIIENGNQVKFMLKMGSGSQQMIEKVLKEIKETK
jgi:hypothetical protein